jgi:SAM-dependent methyltransferase
METKEEKRARKAQASMPVLQTIDCACLIHDTLYHWDYVERLYNSLCRNLTPTVRMHVYTEKTRVVPGHMIHHHLQEWPGIRGPKRSWWYKIQLFDSKYHSGPMLYFDLDTVITGNIDWIWQLPTDRLWAVQDFKYLFRPTRATINSSVMWFDPAKFSYIYREFEPGEVAHRRSPWHGDQDYIQQKLPFDQVGYFGQDRVKSWRWELLDGGYDFRHRKHRVPGSGTVLTPDTSVVIFHGNPKPHEIQDQTVLQHWK